MMLRKILAWLFIAISLASTGLAARADFGLTDLVGLAVGGTGPISTTFAGIFTSSANATSYNLSATGLETTGYRVWCVHGRKATPSLTINSSSLDGVTGTILGAQADNAGTSGACYVAAATSNTSGTLNISLSGTWLRASAAVWNVQNLILADGTAVSDTGTSMTVSIDVAAGGAAYGMVGDAAAGSNVWAWGGITEDSGCDVEPESPNSAGCAHDDFAAAQTGLSVTANRAGENFSLLMVVPMR